MDPNLKAFEVPKDVQQANLECKNSCGNERRHGSAYCQSCSDIKKQGGDKN